METIPIKKQALALEENPSRTPEPSCPLAKYAKGGASGQQL